MREVRQDFKQINNLEIGADAEAIQKTIYCLAVYGLLTLFSYTVQDYLSRGCTRHSGWGSPTLITNQKNDLYRLAYKSI